MARTVTRPRRSAWRVIGDAILIIAIGAIAIGTAILGAIGYPFELPRRNHGDGERARVFWDQLDKGDPVWFADHLVWFAVASASTFLTIGVVAMWVAPRSRLIARLQLGAMLASALVSVAVFSTLTIMWLLGAPASSSPRFSEGLPYLIPILVSGVCALFFVFFTIAARRIGLLRRP